MTTTLTPPAAVPRRAQGSRGRPGSLDQRARPAQPARRAQARTAPKGAGTAVVVGTRSSYLFFTALVAVLCAAGLVMVLSASSVASLSSMGTPWWFFEHQGIYLCIGAIAFFVAQGVRVSTWQQLARPLMFLSLAALVAVLAVGRSAGGASRWLGAGSFQFQPSELAKLALVMFAADVLARREGKRDWVYRAGPVVIVLVIFAGLIMKQPDMGTAVVMCCIGAAILFAGGMPLTPLLGLGAGAAVLGAVAGSAGYRAARLTSFVDPFAHARTSGYQSAQALIALGAGHWTGAGLGQSLASWGYLPNQYTDFIFAVIGQETGFAGSVVMLALFAAIGVIGTRVAWRAATTFESLLAAGITAWLVSQAIINIGAVADVLPVTGVPLPFVSYGGTSLIIVLFAAGLLANVARRAGPAGAP
ncbi:MAG TPA: putative peptidoglycan glycosyltransferase FtsW [Acidimicrobiales bacterium]|nr:putative peptidoglycan glycosyltransferase FtsW [Acidimicrobiales bacterium]